MSYPVTPNPSIHHLPPAVAKQQQQQTVQEIEAGANRFLQAILNAVLNILTGGLLGTNQSNSANAENFLGNLFGNFFNMLGIPDPSTLLAGVEKDVFDSVSTIQNFVTSVLAPTGIFNLAADAQNFFNSIWSALTGTAHTTPKSAADVASAAAQLASTVTDHTNTLSVRDNSAVFLGMGPTEESVFPLSTITTGSPVYLNVTSSNAVTGFIRIGQTVNKDAVTWIGQHTTGITGMYIYIYSVDTTTGDLTLVHDSGNILSGVSTLLSWTTYVMPTGNDISTHPGEVYAVELAVTGSGTYQIVGQDHSWMPDHPTVFPKQLAAFRNNANSGTPPSSILSASVGYSTTTTPWFGMGVDSGAGFHAPVTQSYPTAGPDTYMIPTWAKYIDIILMGGGGCGQYGGAFYTNGQGGSGGVWNATTVTMGVDIPVTTTSITMNVGAGSTGSGGGATTVSATGWTGGLSAAGGTDGTLNGYGSWYSTGGGNETYSGQTYYGGGEQQGSGANGISPGGGGAGGAGGLASRGNGANGVAWFVARAN